MSVSMNPLPPVILTITFLETLVHDSTLLMKHRTELSNNSFEILVPVVFVIVCRPPGPDSALLTQFSEFLSSMTVVDFNIHMDIDNIRWFCPCFISRTKLKLEGASTCNVLVSGPDQLSPLVSSRQDKDIIYT